MVRWEPGTRERLQDAALALFAARGYEQTTATEIAQDDQFESAIVEPPKLLGIVDVTPGIVTVGLTATVRAGDQDAYLRAVRAAIKSAFDQALADDPRADYRPPLVTPPAEAG